MSTVRRRTADQSTRDGPVPVSTPSHPRSRSAHRRHVLRRGPRQGTKSATVIDNSTGSDRMDFVRAGVVTVRNGPVR